MILALFFSAWALLAISFWLQLRSWQRADDLAAANRIIDSWKSRRHSFRVRGRFAKLPNHDN